MGPTSQAFGTPLSKNRCKIIFPSFSATFEDFFSKRSPSQTTAVCTEPHQIRIFQFLFLLHKAHTILIRSNPKSEMREKKKKISFSVVYAMGNFQVLLWQSTHGSDNRFICCLLYLFFLYCFCCSSSSFPFPCPSNSCNSLEKQSENFKSKKKSPRIRTQDTQSPSRTATASHQRAAHLSGHEVVRQGLDRGPLLGHRWLLKCGPLLSPARQVLSVRDRGPEDQVQPVQLAHQHADVLQVWREVGIDWAGGCTPHTWPNVDSFESLWVRVDGKNWKLNQFWKKSFQKLKMYIKGATGWKLGESSQQIDEPATTFGVFPVGWRYFCSAFWFIWTQDLKNSPFIQICAACRAQEFFFKWIFSSFL